MDIKTNAMIVVEDGAGHEVRQSIEVEGVVEASGEEYRTIVTKVDGLRVFGILPPADLVRMIEALEDEFQRQEDALNALPRRVLYETERLERMIERVMAQKDAPVTGSPYERIGGLEEALTDAARRIKRIATDAQQALSGGQQ